MNDEWLSHIKFILHPLCFIEEVFLLPSFANLSFCDYLANETIIVSNECWRSPTIYASDDQSFKDFFYVDINSFWYRFLILFSRFPFYHITIDSTGTVPPQKNL